VESASRQTFKTDVTRAQTNDDCHTWFYGICAWTANAKTFFKAWHVTNTPSYHQLHLMFSATKAAIHKEHSKSEIF